MILQSAAKFAYTEIDIDIYYQLIFNCICLDLMTFVIIMTCFILAS